MDMTCPQCGVDTHPRDFREGVCGECCDENQRALDEHNAGFDRWEQMTDEERDREIREAYRGY